MSAQRRLDGSVVVMLSAMATYLWATRPGAEWPGSAIAGRRLWAEFDANGDLVDYAIDGESIEVDSAEFDAITSDAIAEVYPDHPAIRR